jgi:hypothetical protein
MESSVLGIIYLSVCICGMGGAGTTRRYGKIADVSLKPGAQVLPRPETYGYMLPPLRLLSSGGLRGATWGKEKWLRKRIEKNASPISPSGSGERDREHGSMYRYIAGG